MKLNRKNKLLIAAFLVSLFLCYQLAIKNTLKYYNQYESQKEVLASAHNYPKMLADLTKREKGINNWLSKNDNLSNYFQNELLKQLNLYCASNNLKIVDFKEPHQSVKDQLETNSYTFSVEGPFNTTLKLLNTLENNHNLGFIKHLATEKKVNFKTNEEYLVTTIIIQKTRLLD